MGVLSQRLIRVDTPERLRRELYGQVTRVELSELPPDLVERTQRLPFVDSARAEGNQLFVAIADYEAHDPDLVRGLVEWGGRLLAIERQPQSLEQVYFDLLAQQAIHDSRTAGGDP